MIKKSFTVIELLLVILILSLILPMIFLVYTEVQRTKTVIDIRQQLVQQSYEFFERMNVLLQDYTIDYEEYFNRRMVGCTTAWGKGESFSWTVGGSGHCTEFTAYGNRNSINPLLSLQHVFYYCSSQALHSDPNQPYVNPYVLKPDPFSPQRCLSHGGAPNWHQSYGQYSKLFFDVKRDTDGDGSLVGDSDDEDLGYGPEAIGDAAKVQELYLISPDGKNRLFLRRKFVSWEDLNGDGQKNPWETMYVLQILRLRGFDAGMKHDFGNTNWVSNPGLYDGQIDTWACDASQGFMGKGASIGGAYANYRLPADNDDCWVDLYQGSISLEARNLAIYPTKDPVLAWKSPVSDVYQINPYIKIFLLNRVYMPQRSAKLRNFSANLQIVLQTAFYTKSFYTQ